ncbi:MAG: hypothetical protein A2Z29_03040 [Chloroflexi bacterium RBG_16_56_11]|nr:MAG: hypothetical protein A2Z29_03040 [Chloroflexi bacterium RBG_16_56_11]
MDENVTLLVAFGGGLLSFLSPCVLPMVPVYLASLNGPEVSGGRNGRMPVFLHSLGFVFGFSVVFILLGAIAGLTGFAIIPNHTVLTRVAGSLLIAFGVFILAALKVPWLNYEKRLTAGLGTTTGYFRSFLIGGLFSVSWTACVGPVLGSILTLASVQATAGRGAVLLSVYALGLGLPFLAAGIGFDSLRPVLKGLYRYTVVIRIISGLLLIVVGILIVTGNLAWIASLAA